MVDYEYMLLPDYDSMTKKEAKEYFETFVREIPHRMEILEEYVNGRYKANVKFDYTIESLVPLWAWFESVMTIEERTQEEIDRDLSVLAEWMHDIVLQHTTRPSLTTIAIGNDIAIYFAEVFRKHNSKAYWTYIATAKKHMSYNHPVLMGFVNKMDMNPEMLIITCIRKSLQDRNPNRLVELCNTWSEAIPKD